MQTMQSHCSLREKQRQEREQLILKAAEEILLEKGYYETSMDEIAARVGIAKGTIYHHFPSKEELVAALITWNIEAALREVEAVVAADLTPSEKLDRLIEHVFTGIYSKRARLLSSIYNGVDIKRVFQEKEHGIKEKMDTLCRYTVEILEEGKRVGEFETSISTQAMMYAFFSLFSIRRYDAILLGGKEVPHRELFRQLRHIFLQGITRKQEPSDKE
ncbi:TetR family transcriptional regulator [Thermosporothrix hazakensis]|uniref:TetR family transcriptional regulator n=2 Tax=Thermosporothrix hazakensis TaxID=644383 RepID=A0A326U5K4_THEHA|nr:TetR/AcrR family transcriptional regulator [Thermosporothrix hazakensis]PZW26714.1 TetR family transcriptional regulator [Thermosporothrix hazakensis]GCE47587.1 TetR family transcriptional regulator [Thermosporothrix hazakensis]